MRAGLLTGLVWLASAASALACTAVPTPGVGEYRNFDYQFSVTIPHELRGCMVSAPCPNHGLWMPLEAIPSCANSHDGHRYIDVEAGANTAFEAATPAELAAFECRRAGASRILWLTGEMISGRRAVGCRRDFLDGHIEVMLTVLRKTEAWRARWIQLSASLVTTPTRYGADMSLFRRVLRGIWVHPDGPIR